MGFEDVLIGGVGLGALVFGLVQFLKEVLGWDGKRVTVLAVFLGFAFMLAAQVAPAYPVINEWLIRVVVSLAFALSVPGFYKFATRHETVSDDMQDAYNYGLEDGYDEGVESVVDSG